MLAELRGMSRADAVASMGLSLRSGHCAAVPRNMNSLTDGGGANVEHASDLNGPERA